MITKLQFEILLYLLRNKCSNSKQCSIALEADIHNIIKDIELLSSSGFIDKELSLTTAGIETLNQFKVDNAIIMAAGMSRRFLPLSIEHPKGLCVVKDEILIERQIRQLQNAGIFNIFIIVGYLKEQFYYLEKKFGVRIITNTDYYRYNNISSLISVADKLGNSYICSSDNYFTKNIFSSHVYKPYYAAVFSSGETKEYCIEYNNENLITDVKIGGEKAWYMFGQAYFDKKFSKKFVNILFQYYRESKSKDFLWEDLYIKHIDQLPLYIQKYDNDIIFEFDTIDDLRLFDTSYINGIKSKIFDNICHYFHCLPKDITNITAEKEGMTNDTFSFTLHNQRYVYRHPGNGTETYINRNAEIFATNHAKALNLDSSIIYMDRSGWKLSHFRSGARHLDYNNWRDIEMAIELMQRLHDQKIKSDFVFDVWDKILFYIDLILKSNSTIGKRTLDTISKMHTIHDFIKNDDSISVLCHCDCYAPNFLVHGDVIELIDWEYAASTNPAVDLGIFISSSADFTYEDALSVLEIYYKRKLTNKELIHAISYIALSSFYLFISSKYLETLGRSIGKYLAIWNRNADFYSDKAIALYEKSNCSV